jgi:hypothetical protein
MIFKKIAFILLVVFLSIDSFAQRDNKYKSKEENDYYKLRTWSEYEPIDSNKILNFNSSQIQFRELENYTKFQSIYHWSPLQDSIFNIDFLTDTNYKPQNIAGIPLTWIVKMDTTDSNGYIVYSANKYDDFVWGEQGYWIAVKKNLEWEKYYTGLSVNTPIYFKWDSKLDLLKDKNTIQIESSLLRLVERSGHPGPGPEYELLKDGIVTEILIDSLKKDSDLDGLTDIEERKMMLNPYSADTDNDGINDYLDLNPRFKRQSNDKSSMYEFLLSQMEYFHGSDTLIGFDINPKVNYFADSIPTYLIVTDDPNLQSIYPIDSRLIILTQEEFKNHNERYPNTFLDITVSPMFKVNWRKNTYKISTSFMTGGETYLIKKQKKGWKIKIIMSWIS